MKLIDNLEHQETRRYGRDMLFEPADAERAFFVARTAVSFGITAFAIVLALAWDWSAGLFVAAAASAVVIDGSIRLNRGSKLPLWLVIAVDITAAASATLLADLPDVVVAAPFAYFVTAAALVLPPRQSLGLAAYLGAWALAILVLDAPLFDSGLTGSQEKFVLATTVVLYLAATFALTWIAAAAVRDRQALDANLRASQTQLRTVVDNAPVVVFAVNQSGVFTLSEGAALAGLGLRAGEVVGMTIDTIYADYPDVIKLIGNALENGEDLRHEFTVAGSTYDVHTRPVQDADGLPQGLIGIATDITEQTTARMQLEQMVRSKDEFIASVSHELRTPLTSVLGLAEELRERAASLSEEEVAEFHEIIATQAWDLTSIVADLLVVARDDTESIAIVTEPVDLEPEVLGVIELCLPEECGRIAVDSTSTVADCDVSRLRQIVRNLISNALRHGGPDIEVLLRPEGSTAVIEVADNGIGISLGDQDRIFEAYEVAGLSPGKPGSIGLGLTVAKRLTERMAGELTYRYEGGLSVFRLVLPGDPTNQG